jgi:hypothetical protein
MYCQILGGSFLESLVMQGMQATSKVACRQEKAAKRM